MILLIDNYDSFTFNLVHFLVDIGVPERSILVVRNDTLTTTQIKKSIRPDRIILSPGPCTPNESGICPEVVQELSGCVPILGICLGHQVIGQVYGGSVVRAPEPIHGKPTVIAHDGRGIFRGIPQEFTATRYHSLVVDSLPSCLEVSARNEQGLIMGIRHRVYRDTIGLQFHPESLFTDFGHQMLRNFVFGYPRCIEVEAIPDN